MDRFLNVIKLKEFYVENTKIEKRDDQTIEECFDENFNLDAILEEIVNGSMTNGSGSIEIQAYNKKSRHVESIDAERTNIFYLCDGKILANPVFTSDYFDITNCGVVIGTDKFGNEELKLPENLKIDDEHIDEMLEEIENKTDSIEYIFTF